MKSCNGSRSWRIVAIAGLLAGQVVNGKAVHAQADGNSPVGGLIQASDSLLYGTTEFGAKFNDGCVYKIAMDGTGYGVVRSFGSSSADAMEPEASVIQATDGLLYGTTAFGGKTNGSTFFHIALDGSTYSVIHSLGDSIYDGTSALTPVIEGTDSYLYGTCVQGGKYFEGTIYILSRDGSYYQTLHSFDENPGDGEAPSDCLVEASDGNLYGVTPQTKLTGRGTIYKIALDGTGYKSIYYFGSVPSDGNGSEGALIQASNGYLYGTSPTGGKFDDGVIFRLATDGSGYKIVYSFGSIEDDGTVPECALVEGPQHRLYDTTFSGGKYKLGLVFGINLDGSNYTPMHSFGTSFVDGLEPMSGLCLASDGNLYGTAYTGGKYNEGLVYSIAPDGSNYRALHSFTS